MKEKIIAVIFFIILMALLPFTVSKCTGGKTKITAGSTSDVAVKPPKTNTVNTDNNTEHNYDDTLTALVAAKYKSTYCTETIKAITIIMNTNYSAYPQKFKSGDFLYKSEANNSLKEVYSQIQNAVNSVKEKRLYINGKNLFVPFSDSSNGKTYLDSSYSYVSSVASPWDCFEKNTNAKNKCVGVSINGIDCLCKKDSSCEDALKWYLPNFEIK